MTHDIRLSITVSLNKKRENYLDLTWILIRKCCIAINII